MNPTHVGDVWLLCLQTEGARSKTSCQTCIWRDSYRSLWTPLRNSLLVASLSDHSVTLLVGMTNLVAASFSMKCWFSSNSQKFSPRYVVLYHSRLLDCLRHSHSAIWFELSNPRAASPHVIRNVALNTRPSFSHVQGGVVTTLSPECGCREL